MKYLKKTMVFFIIAVWSWPLSGETIDLERVYLGVDFDSVIRHCEARDYQSLTMGEKLLFIECLARTGKGKIAGDRMKQLLAAQPSDAGVLAAAGILSLSLGRLDEAVRFTAQALEKKPDLHRALLSNVMLALYYRDFDAARKRYEQLAASGGPWADSDLLFLVGLDVYRACGDPRKLSRLYKQHARLMKKTDRNRFKNLEANYKMHRRAGKRGALFFQAQTDSDRAAVPFSAGARDFRMNTIAIKRGDRVFKVILDTGNATGWMVHGRELMRLSKPVSGGRAITRIGTEAGMLDGFRQYYLSVDFNDFKLLHANGIYVPKPHPDYPDANLNPGFIRGRVVTIDFIKNELVLRTKERFEKDLASRGGEKRRVFRLPWYGYKFAYAPFSVKDKQGLVMVETGAEDIAFKADFIEGLGLPLRPRVKYLADGQTVHYYQTTAALAMDGLEFQRKDADVWPLDRFYNRLSGLSADAVLGPRALEGTYVLSFDPFDKQIILEQVY
jgi:tetratricopeptide (TPR) repeat protein